MPSYSTNSIPQTDSPAACSFLLALSMTLCYPNHISGPWELRGRCVTDPDFLIKVIGYWCCGQSYVSYRRQSPSLQGTAKIMGYISATQCTEQSSASYAVLQWDHVHHKAGWRQPLWPPHNPKGWCGRWTLISSLLSKHCICWWPSLLSFISTGRGKPFQSFSQKGFPSLCHSWHSLQNPCNFCNK